MNEVDVEIEKAERYRSPQHELQQQPQQRHDSNASGTSSGMSRVATQADVEEGLDAVRTRTVMTRTKTAQSVFEHTISRHPERTVSKKLPPFGGGKPYPPDLPEKDDFVVDWTGYDDPMHPQQWTNKKKYTISALLAFTSSFCTWGSSVFSPAVLAVATQFHVGRVVATLSISFYILGFAFGPILWAPLSELYGRRYPLLIAMFGFTLFQFAVATGKDLQTIMLSRFFGGCFASAPLSLVGAAYADIWDNDHRGYAITIFSMTVSVPALLAPVVSGFIVTSPDLGWRWTEYITGICGGIMFLLNVFFLEETYAPVVLVTKARELRRLTKNWGIHAKQEEIEIDFKELIEKNFSRPLKLLFTEPIVFFVSLYVAFIYGMLYLMLSAFPLSFAGVHHMKGGVAGLPFIALCIGQLLGGFIVILWEPTYVKRTKANKGLPIPENRLPPAMLGAIVFPIGLFWFAWTGGDPSIHWAVPAASGIFIGCGILLIFLQCLNYIIDSYLMFAASAISANSFLRSIFGAVFPLFATQMFHALKIKWAGTLLALVACVLVPMPFVFYKYGKQIRKKSKYAPTFSEGMH